MYRSTFAYLPESHSLKICLVYRSTFTYLPGSHSLKICLVYRSTFEYLTGNHSLTICLVYRSTFEYLTGNHSLKICLVFRSNPDDKHDISYLGYSSYICRLLIVNQDISSGFALFIGWLQIINLEIDNSGYDLCIGRLWIISQDMIFLWVSCIRLALDNQWEYSFI